MLLNNDSFIFSDLRNKNICVIPQTLQKKLYETQSGTPRIRVTGSGDEPGGDGGKEASLQEGHVRSVAPASGRMSSRTPVTPRLPTHSPPSRTGTSSASGGRWSIVLKDGVVAEMGRPSELIEQQGIYKHMLETQKLAASWQL